MSVFDRLFGGGSSASSGDAACTCRSMFRGADRVEHVSEKDEYGNPAKYTVYGIVCNNVSRAVTYWRDRNGAGWRTIPVRDLKPFLYPDMSKLHFRYVARVPKGGIRPDTKGDDCVVRYYRIDKDDGSRLMACVKFANGERACVNTQNLYALADPSSF